METLYTLTPAEADTLSNLDQSDVIAAGPWRRGSMSLAHRAVIRDLGKEYVVHNQIIDCALGKACYDQGFYVTKDQVLSLEVAWTKFEIRVRRHHSWPELG